MLIPGTSLASQWFRFCASYAGGMGSIPGQGTKIPHLTCHWAKNKVFMTKSEHVIFIYESHLKV